MLEFLKELIFPSKCLNCLQQTTQDEVLCRKCKGGIKLNQTLFCGQCLARLPEGKKICHRSFPYSLGAALDYKDEAVRKLILGLKFGRCRNAANFLGELASEYAKTIPIKWGDFLAVPVPLGRRRENERGFNQAELIARVLAEKLDMDINTKNLSRIKNTPPQSEINNFESRMKNVAGIFQAVDPDIFANRKIVLVDDVTTSGATLKEAAGAIKKCRPKTIIALAAARA